MLNVEEHCNEFSVMQRTVGALDRLRILPRWKNVSKCLLFVAEGSREQWSTHRFAPALREPRVRAARQVLMLIN